MCSWTQLYRNLKRGRKDKEHTLEDNETEDLVLDNNEENEGKRESKNAMIEEEDDDIDLMLPLATNND